MAILAATPVLSLTDGGNAGFNTTALVAAPNGTEYLGAAQHTEDG